MTKNIMHLSQHMDMESLIFTFTWYQLLCFSTQTYFKLCWWITQLQRWVAVTIIRMLHHVPKQWGEMVLLTFFCTLPNVSLSIKQNLLQKYLFTRHRWSHYIQGYVSRLLKIFQNLQISKRPASDFITSHEDTKNSRKQIGLQCYITIPRRVTIIYDNQIDSNENIDVLKYLNEVPPSNDWFSYEYIDTEVNKKLDKNKGRLSVDEMEKET